MRTWNYRLFSARKGGGQKLSIRAAYYDCDGTHHGKPCDKDHVPHLWGSAAEIASGEDVEELRFKLDGMLEALGRPCLVLDGDGRLVSGVAKRRPRTKRTKRRAKGG